MRLFRQGEVPADEQGLLCRQSRLAGIVRLIVWRGLVGVLPFFGWKLGEPWLIGIGIALAAIVIPMTTLDLAAMFRATNWLMRIGTGGLWINLCSYRERDVVPDAPSVVRLDYAEIASVRQYSESYTTPQVSTRVMDQVYAGAGDHSTAWRDKFLEIELIHDQTAELKAALNNLRFPPAPAEPMSRPVRVRGRISPVWLVNPSVLRIAWLSSHGAVIGPCLAQVLSQLETYVRVAPPARRVRPNWRTLTPEEATGLARQLVHVFGETFAAGDLLDRACRIAHRDAMAGVEKFEAEEIEFSYAQE